jgi:two-component system phosphate regulon sensor histidine kinase PhoR
MNNYKNAQFDSSSPAGSDSLKRRLIQFLRVMRNPGRLFWKLFLGNALLMFLVLGVCLWGVFYQVEKYHRQELVEHLRARAETVRYLVADDFDAANAGRLNELVNELAEQESSELRITLVALNGDVLAETDYQASEMESHAERSEIRKALAKGWGSAMRISDTLNRQMLYTAVRVGSEDQPAGVVRVALPRWRIAEYTATIRRLTWIVVLVGFGAVTILALGLAHLWSDRIRHISRFATQISRGDLSSRVHVTGQDELSALADALNSMRRNLTSQMNTIERQRQTLEALLNQLNEGVIVAGPQGNILLFNPVAARLLDLPTGGSDPLTPFGKLAVEECIPNYELQTMLLSRNDDRPEESSIEPPPEEDEVQVREVHLRPGEQQASYTLLARASDIALPQLMAPMNTDDSAELVGRLLVLTDITQLARTMRMKADFAANASHELRTPLSAIRAALDTLNTMDIGEKPESAQRFIQLIDKHSTRIQAMIEDLLNLSRIELGMSRFQQKQVSLRKLLTDLETRFEEKLQAKDLSWESEIDCERDIIKVSPYLLTLSLDNLVDNAIKFTEPGGKISVTAWETAASTSQETMLHVEVSDTGIGIDTEEQRRVFERFYQVDRARTAGKIGTGLGLSIVRHAVTALGGSIKLESEIGRGTSFIISLPQSKTVPILSEETHN